MTFCVVGSKGKTIPLQNCTGPEGFQDVEAPRFQDNRHIKVVRLSALRTGRFYTPPSKYSQYSHMSEAVVSRVRCYRSGTPVVTERLVPEGCWFRLVLDT